jgi:hypothetical protein
MKKLLLLIFMLVTTQVFAQRFGINAGLAKSTYSAVGKTYRPGYSKSDISTSSKTGIILGGFVDVALTQNLVFRPGFSLVGKGAVEYNTFTNNGTPRRMIEHIGFLAFDFPFNIIYKIKGGKGHFLFGGGVTPGILSEYNFDGFDLGANGLAGYELANGLSANVTYTYGLLNVATNALYYESLKNRHLGIVLGYTFPRRSTTKPVSPEAGTDPFPPPATTAKVLFAELGGPGGVPSLNFDTRLEKSRKGWGFRAGFGFLNDQDGEGFAIPVALNYLVGERSHFFEMGAGASLYKFNERSQSSFFDFPNENGIAPFAWFGYRYQPLAKGFFFRAGFNKFLIKGTGELMNAPFPSLSFGYAFQ